MLIEDHEAIYQPPAAEHPAYPNAAAAAPNGNTSGGSDFGLPSIDSTPLLVDGADLPPTQQGSGLSSSSLASWLDGIYNGLSAVAPALIAAGAGSSAQLAELAYLGDSTLDDFIASASRLAPEYRADLGSGRARSGRGGPAHLVPPGHPQERHPLALRRRLESRHRRHGRLIGSDDKNRRAHGRWLVRCCPPLLCIMAAIRRAVQLATQTGRTDGSRRNRKDDAQGADASALFGHCALMWPGS